MAASQLGLGGGVEVAEEAAKATAGPAEAEAEAAEAGPREAAREAARAEVEERLEATCDGLAKVQQRRRSWSRW